MSQVRRIPMRSANALGTRRERGVAIVMALLVVTLAASGAAYLTWQQHLWLRQAENLAAQSQARTVGRAAIDWARLIMQEDKTKDKIDHLGEVWATSLPPTPVENGEFTGGIEDAQGLYNINNLASLDKNREMYERLLQLLGLPTELAASAQDWVDADDQVSAQGGAEDLDYLSLREPYRAANMLMSDINNLYRVKGYNADIIKKLRPYVTALPATDSKINVNTAPALVLAALAPGMSADDGKAVEEKRKQNHFTEIKAFQDAHAGFKRLNSALVDVQSNFFLIRSVTRFDRVQLAYTALLDRGVQGAPKILWQRQD